LCPGCATGIELLRPHPIGKADIAVEAGGGSPPGREEVNGGARQKRLLGKRHHCLMSGCFNVELS